VVRRGHSGRPPLVSQPSARLWRGHGGLGGENPVGSEFSVVRSQPGTLVRRGEPALSIAVSGIHQARPVARVLYGGWVWRSPTDGGWIALWWLADNGFHPTTEGGGRTGACELSASSNNGEGLGG
jgi:hypothetical protein